MIEELGVCDMIHLVGDCADMPAAYSWAEAVIAPSTRPEAFGRVAVEAGAMERPVIAANHGGAKETVIDGTSGVLVEPGDADALADAIDRVMAMSADDRRVMGENGRARAVSVYSAAAMCDATLRAVQRPSGQAGVTGGMLGRKQTNILVIKTDSLAAFVAAEPAFEAIRDAHQKSKISLLTAPGLPAHRARLSLFRSGRGDARFPGRGGAQGVPEAA